MPTEDALHQVKVDYPGFYGRQRLTCYTCEGATIVQQPYMSYDQWLEKVRAFLVVHPSDIKIVEEMQE